MAHFPLALVCNLVYLGPSPVGLWYFQLKEKLGQSTETVLLKRVEVAGAENPVSHSCSASASDDRCLLLKGPLHW